MTSEISEQNTSAGTEERFDTFQGVLRPILLTVLGAMLYLREGWLVGNCGLAGALLIICAAYCITGTTALSISSIATNVRVRPGGAFAIIAQALGVEAGGAIGIPLFFAQTASASMYLFAFTEAWAYLFPTHPILWVLLVAMIGLSVLSWTSTSLAFKAQALMLLIVVLALGSAFLGILQGPIRGPVWIGEATEASFGEAFAIFFPAATGMMVGVGMSGVLDKPRRSIPRGTLSAWGITLVVYITAAFWYALVADPQTLIEDKTVMIRHALWEPLVIFGLICSTLMATLSSLVAAPRLLHAMALQRAVPFGSWLEKSSASGLPRNALLVTLALAALLLLTGSLDAIAPVVTSFFIVTYLAVNLVVVLEQRLGMISFRPTFEIPPLIPLLGLAACTIGLMVCSPGFGLVELLVVLGIYLGLQRQKLHTPWETARSGIAVTIAGWAAKRASRMERTERAWKPDLLVPVVDLDEAEALVPLLKTVTHHNGSVKLIGVKADQALNNGLLHLKSSLAASGLYATSTVLDGSDYAQGTMLAMDAMRGAFFTPNMVVVDGSRHAQSEIQAILDHCRISNLGMALYLHPPDEGQFKAEKVSVWLSERSPHWPLEFQHNSNVDLPVLMAYLLVKTSAGDLRLATVLPDDIEVAPAMDFLGRVIERGRLPARCTQEIFRGDFKEVLRSSNQADINVLGLAQEIDLESLLDIRDASGGACLFLHDSGQESLLA
jgi:amino acid transporter